MSSISVLSMILNSAYPLSNYQLTNWPLSGFYGVNVLAARGGPSPLVIGFLRLPPAQLQQNFQKIQLFPVRETGPFCALCYRLYINRLDRSKILAAVNA